MNINFEANQTMKIIGNESIVTRESKEGKAIEELLEGCNMPLTADNIMLCSFALRLGQKLN